MDITIERLGNSLSFLEGLSETTRLPTEDLLSSDSVVLWEGLDCSRSLLPMEDRDLPIELCWLGCMAVLEADRAVDRESL